MSGSLDRWDAEPGDDGVYNMVRLFLDLGEFRTGAWCPTCLLPSALEADLVRMSEAGVSVIAVVSCCPDCGEYEQRDP